MQILHCVILYFIYEAQCGEKVIKSKNPLPYFRRHLEEITEDTITQSTLGDDLRSNLVSFLIKNIKEIYGELDEGDHTEFSVSKVIFTVVDTPTISVDTTNTFDGALDDTTSDDPIEDVYTVAFENNVNRDFSLFDSDSDNFVTNISSGSIDLTDEEDTLEIYKSATLEPFSAKEIINMDSSTTANGLTKKDEIMHLSKNLIFFETDHKNQDNILQTIDSYTLNVSGGDVNLAYKTRSCIYCNNVALENCNDPKHRLIPSTVCERDDDLCYSLHTPFGVIDRGCFNLKHNLTTYVCSCNLCNYISISEMPYIFSKKRNWVDNVAELSRTRQFRKSVLKEMSCLKCETNSSTETGNVIDSANCLEGNIGSLPTEYCEHNEVCAVRAIRKDGYVWRGCVKFPLFNYWWNLCDYDLCNYDTIVSIYNTE